MKNAPQGIEITSNAFWRRQNPENTSRLPYLKIVAQVIGFAAISSAAAAEAVTCTFETECYEAEPCDEAALSLRLIPGDTLDTLVLRSPSERTTGTLTTMETGTRVWQALTPSTVQVLSWSADAARYTLHLTGGPALVSYHGICEAED